MARDNSFVFVPLSPPSSAPDLFVTKFVSVPREMGHLNPAAFVAGIVRGALDGAGFPARCCGLGWVGAVCVQQRLAALWMAVQSRLFPLGAPGQGCRPDCPVVSSMACSWRAALSQAQAKQAGTAATPATANIHLVMCLAPSQGDGPLRAGAGAAAPQDGHTHEVPGGLSICRLRGKAAAGLVWVMWGALLGQLILSHRNCFASLTDQPCCCLPALLAAELPGHHAA